MYLFFLIFFIVISISLIFLILLQPAKGPNNTVHSNLKNNVKCFNSIGTNTLITNIIRIFSCLFLVISIILCNINSRKIDSDLFWKDDYKKTVEKNHFSNKKMLHSDIPH